jgi:hypothetical protein
VAKMESEETNRGNRNKIPILVMLIIVIVAGIGIIIAFQQNQPKFTASRTLEKLLLNTGIYADNPVPFYSATIRIQYHGTTPITNAYVFVDEKQVIFVPIIQNGWSIKYEKEYVGDEAPNTKIRIVWTGGEQILTVE